MHKNARLNLIILLALCGLLALAPLSAHAQASDLTSTPAAAEDNGSPEGIALLFLLAGLGALTAVGGTMLARDSFKQDES